MVTVCGSEATTAACRRWRLARPEARRRTRCPGRARLPRHGATVQRDERLDDREPETEPALRAIEGLALLREELEHARQHLR